MNDAFALVFAGQGNPELRELIEMRSVAALPVGGRYRVIDFLLSNLSNSAVRAVGLITTRNYKSLMDHIGGGKPWGLGGKTNGMFVLPGAVYGRRTFNSKLQLRDLLVNRPFLERSGDVRMVIASTSRIMKIDYDKVATFHDHIGADITLVYKKNFATPGDPYSPALELDEDGRVIGVSYSEAKPCNCYLESLIIDNQLLLNFMTWYSAMDYMGIMDLVAENLKQFKVYAYEFDGYVGAVDDLKGYFYRSMELLDPAIAEELLGGEKPIATKTQDYPPTKYAATAKVSNSLIASGSIIEGTVENSIISRSVYVGPGAVVRNCVLMPSTEIGREANLNYVICDKRAKVADFVTLAGTHDAPFAMGKQQVAEINVR